MKTSRIITISLLLLGVSASAHADWNSFWHKQKITAHNCKVEYLRNQCWPHPFLEADMHPIRNSFSTMTNNGWRLHHTLSNDVFREQDNELTAVGRNRLAWISTQSPENRRMVYILQGATREDTDARMASVNEALTHIQHVGSSPQVMVTAKIPFKSSGEWNRNLSVSRRDNVPPVVLQPDDGGGGGGE